jgi:CheY-like chemotaxis protein/HPt (histidine-containing phosphotransfer) domain-containing protein
MGTGLGLSISKKLSDLMDGVIDFSSEYGQGSRFTFLLPLVEGQADQVDQIANPAMHIIATSDVNVLVVEDNPTNIKVVQEYLKLHRIRADTANNGREALQKVQETNYDLVFMDHMMPVMDGVEAVRHIRALPNKWLREMPIVALSANVFTDAKNLFLGAGMNDFIAKPIRAEEFNRILAKWLPADKQFSVAIRNRVYIQDSCESIGTINRSIGLKNAANRDDLYEKLLRSFKFDHAQDYEKLTSALAAGEVPLARQMAHTLKSTAGLIGAVSLQAVALCIEQALSNGNQLEERLLQEFESEFNAVMEELEPIAATIAGLEPAHGNVNKMQAIYLVGKLLPLLSAKNTDCLNMTSEISEILSPAGKSCARLLAQIDDFDFDGALETLLAIRQSLMI